VSGTVVPAKWQSCLPTLIPDLWIEARQ